MRSGRESWSTTCNTHQVFGRLYCNSLPASRGIARLGADHPACWLADPARWLQIYLPFGLPKRDGSYDRTDDREKRCGNSLCCFPARTETPVLKVCVCAMLQLALLGQSEDQSKAQGSVAHRSHHGNGQATQLFTHLDEVD